MANEYLKKLKEFSERLDTDPQYLAEVQEKLLAQMTISDNEDAFGVQEPSLSTGDMIARLIEPNYLEEKRSHILDVWYAFHGQGD